MQLDSLRREVLELVELAAALLAQVHQRAGVVGRGDDRDLEVGLLDVGDALRIGQLGRIVDLDDVAVGALDPVRDARRRGDEGKAELPLEALLDDLHVQQARGSRSGTRNRGHPTTPAYR